MKMKRCQEGSQEKHEGRRKEIANEAQHYANNGNVI